MHTKSNVFVSNHFCHVYIGRTQVMELLKEKEILEGVNIKFNKELGRGSYGAVYEAEWRGLSCVAKVFHEIIFPNQPGDTWKQLAREIELLQNIRHPNIVQLLGFIPETQSKIPSIVMERLNTNLTKLIEEHHSLLSFDMQVCILHDVAVGLSFLHGHKEPIIHRDLSSNNILLTDHLIAKISDLGLAKHIKSAEPQTGSFTGFGTQDYMPPEVLGQKPPKISPKTDVFSLGVVMLQLATGKAPDVRGILNVDTEADRRKHHLGMLNKNNLFHPAVLQCLSNKSNHRPTAVALCATFKKFGVSRKSTLMHIKTSQDEKLDLTKQLENRMENERKLQQDKIALETKLDEEKEAAVLNTKRYETEMNDVLTFTTKLQKDLYNEKETQKVLHTEITKYKNAAKAFQEENVDLARQLEALKLKKDNDKRGMQEKLQKERAAFQARLDEEKIAANLEIQTLKKELNDALNAKHELQNTLFTEKETQKLLHAEIIQHKNAIKVSQEDTVRLAEQLEANKLEKDNDMQIMQEQLRSKTAALQARLDEEKIAANLEIQTLKKELNDALNTKSEMQNTLTTEKETQKLLHAEIIQHKEEIIELTKQIEALKLEKDNDMQNMQERFEKERVALQTRLTEEEKAAISKIETLRKELNDSLNTKCKLQNILCTEKESKKTLHSELSEQKNAAEAFQKENVELTKQLEILQLQTDRDMQNMQERFEKERVALQTRLTEEEKAAISKIETLRKELNDSLNTKCKLQNILCTEKESKKTLHSELSEQKNAAEAFQKENVELTKQLEILQLQTDRDMQNMQDKLQELNDALNAKSESEKTLYKEIETQRNLHAQQTKDFQEEKFKFVQQLTAYRSQSKCDAINIQKIKDQSQEEISAVKTKLNEAKLATISKVRDLKAKLNVEKMIHSNLYVEISNLKAKLTEAIECQSLDTAKQLVDQNRELSNLVGTLKDCFDRLNKNNVTDKLQKGKNDWHHISVELQDRENRLSMIKESLQHDTKIGLSTTSAGNLYPGSPNKVSC